MPNEPRENTISPLPPSFISIDESSICENDSSRFTDSDADTISTPAPIPRESSGVSKSQLVASNPSTKMAATPVLAEGCNHTSIQLDTTKEPVDSATVHTASAAESANNGSSSKPWQGFVVVGDNVDKKVKPRYMTSDNQSKDLHYFHLYALKDRIDLSEASEDPLNLNPDAVLATLIPTDDDIKEMISNFRVLIARQLIQHFPYFQQHFSDVVEEHIPHPHQAEMKEISEVVSTASTLHSIYPPSLFPVTPSGIKACLLSWWFSI